MLENLFQFNFIPMQQSEKTACALLILLVFNSFMTQRVIIMAAIGPDSIHMSPSVLKKPIWMFWVLVYNSYYMGH